MDSVIILLGAPNDSAGGLSSIAIERCLLALNVFRRNPNSFILPTGGFGLHFNTSPKPHAFYTRAFLVAKGVPPEHILEGAHSRFTLEDAELAKPIVDKHGVRDLIVVTSDFHLERTEHIFNRVFTTYNLAYAGSHTGLPEAQLKSLIEHEKDAISRMSLL